MSGGGGETMQRGGSNGSGSGGVRVGGKMIEFGDYPEPVDLQLARERVLNWGERERKAKMEREGMENGSVGLGIL